MPEPIADAVVGRAQEGDTAAIGKLYKQHHLKVFQYLCYRVGDREAADDLTSEVFLRMVKSLPRYRQQSTAFEAWLFRIARNLAIDYFRKMKFRRHATLEEGLVSDRADPGAAVEQGLTAERLEKALNGLNGNQRDVIALRFAAEMPIAQVSQTLGKSEAAVKALQRRALIALRGVLAE